MRDVHVLLRREPRAAQSARRTRSRSSGVSTPIESCVVSTAWMRMPCSSARSCSSASARSSAVGGSAREPQQAVAPVDVEPDVAPRRRRRLAGARERDRRARKVQREALAIDDDLRDVRVRSSAASSMPLRSVVITTIGSASSGATASSIIAGSISGSSPCTLTTISRVELRGDFGEPIGAARMSGRGHARRRRRRRAPRRGCARRRSRRSPTTRRGGRGAAVDVLDHRPAADVGERFARKPGRVISGGDDGDDGA